MSAIMNNDSEDVARCEMCHIFYLYYFKIFI